MGRTRIGALAIGLALLACGGEGGTDAGADGAAPDAGRLTDGGGSDACVPRCEGLACGDDGCGGVCGSCGEGLACRDGRCETESCPAGCTSGCPQGCFELGACVDTGGALDLHANVYTVGVVLSPASGATEGVVYYRRAGASTWWRAPELAALPDGTLATSLFELVPDAEYEVRAEAGGAIACGTLRTQPIDPAHTTAATLHVDASAGSGGDGSEGAPFATIQEAIDAAGAGTDVIVHAGVYREEVAITSGGAEGAYLRVIGEPGAILDGADPVAPAWTADGAGVWWTSWSGDPRYVGRDGARLYHYLSLADLRSGTGDDGVPIAEGFFVEGGRLYVRSAADPSSSTFQIPVRNTAIAVRADWVWIEGLEIGWYGEGEYAKGVDVVDADHVVVRGSLVHDVPSPIWFRRGASDARVEGCEIHQSSVYEWPWDAVKGTDHENSAITQEGGRGFLASGNRIHDIFNGIYTGSFDDDRNTAIAFDADVYANRFARIGDDVLEPEGACVNNRFRGNVADHLHNGLSLAPITFGPVWAIRNRFADYEESGFKVSNGSSGRVWLFHNTCFTDRPDHNGMDVSGDFENIVFRNNVVRGTRYALEQSREALPNDLDYDNWFTTRGAPVIKWSNVRYDDVAAWCAATTLECHGVADDPMLVDPSGGVFALTPGSPNVDRGERLYGINDQFAGAAPDLGYVELGSPEPPPL